MNMEQIVKGDELTQSLDIVNDNIARMKQLFPEVFTEGKIDFKVLQNILGDEIETEEEYYRFTWAGKAQARREAHKPSIGTLRPCKEDSVNWDTTENLYIEGDNLEVLKLLQKSYNNKVKMIYIDPPYNTGKDFIYKDNYKDNLKNYQQITGQIDDEGNKLTTNSDSDGHYHSNWLNMMYPRLKLARNLLKEDGVIFLSIDENEIENLKKLCNEIFGEENFLAQLIWYSEGNTDNQLQIKVKHEYILLYLKDYKFKDMAIGRVVDPNTREDSNLWKGYADNNINKNSPANPPSIIELPIGFPCSEKELFYEKKKLDDDFFSITKKEKFISDAVRIKYDIENQSGLPIKVDDLLVENFELKKECRIYGGFANANKLKRFIETNFQPVLDDDGSPITFYLNRNAAVRYRKKVDKPRNIISVLNNFGTTEKNKTELKNIGIPFSYPKPVGLIKYLLKIGAEDNNSIVLDFFAGSSTTAHAVIELNIENDSKIKFIQVQLSEKTDENSSAFKAGFKTISEIGKSRIKKTISIIKEKSPLIAENHDLGFKSFKLDSSNIKAWDGNPDNLEQNLFDSQDNIKTDRSEEDVLFEILLKYGLDLTLPIEEKIIEGKKVFNVGLGALFICLANGITSKVAEGIGAWKQEINPETCRVIFKDSGFTDVEKTNAVQTLKRFGIHEIKSI
jgi:adenine-specific DNA-methyltransferase